jgi:hypothetical protein
MTGNPRLPTRLQCSRPEECVETISQGYAQTTGFSSEISSRQQSFSHGWKCPPKRVFFLWEKTARGAMRATFVSPRTILSIAQSAECSCVC